jgi:hypothetical protein
MLQISLNVSLINASSLRVLNVRPRCKGLYTVNNVEIFSNQYTAERETTKMFESPQPYHIPGIYGQTCPSFGEFASRIQTSERSSGAENYTKK